MPVRALDLRPREDCRWELVSLGEVMLRLDPGDRRISTARSFDVWEGGGEYNVARGLRRCFGLPTGLVTAFADNPVGRLIEDFVLQGGVDVSHVEWVPFDGVGRTVRNGLNFTERGFGARGAVGCSDRGNTAASQLRPGQIDWDAIFGSEGARWLHCGGIFCALSETTSAVAREAFEAARRHGTVVSYDLNYRESLWKAIGGHERAAAVNRDLVSLVDVVVGNEEDFQLALGFAVEGVDEALVELDPAAYGRMLEQVAATYPNLAVLAVTLRSVHSATRNGWGALCLSAEGVREATYRPDLEILDRIGGGDSFASGLFYGFLEGLGAKRAVELGAAHGALAMTTPGDTSMATLAEVERLASRGSARVVR
jgi:2-dehydro-3-deoxygluconokinase